MTNCGLHHDQLPSQLKHIVAALFRLDLLEPDEIADDEPLIGGSLGLDSLDALELAICIEEEFGLTVQSREDSQRVFASIASLAGFIRAQATTKPVPRHSPGIAANSLAMLTSPSPG